MGVPAQPKMADLPDSGLDHRLRIFTVAFDAETKTFRDEELRLFLAGRRLLRSEAAFFQVDGVPFWSVLLEYREGPHEGEPKEEPLAGPAGALMERLREWRKEEAARRGLPVYVIATNSELRQVAARMPHSFEGLRSIKGFGKRKIEEYGAAILEEVKSFVGERARAEGGSPDA
ncbi:HRDC domain-containing protein [Candidatus Fermentibacteria bacterium]|nr:HRDC domain-containing protein [Candidatus Fermentibacteria bacterium]